MSKDVNVDIHFVCGKCPVQGEGTINGIPFYFRSRGNKWSISIGSYVPAPNTWTYSEPYGDDMFNAGYMNDATAREMIQKAAHIYVNK